MSQKRPRASISPQELAAMLAPYITNKRSLAYPERGPVNKLIIQTNAGMIGVLRRGLDTLAIAPATTDAAFMILSDNIPNLKSEHQQEWSKVMGRKLRLMLRHTAQALVRKPRGCRLCL